MCLACFAGLETGPSKEARKAPVGWTKERVGAAAGGVGGLQDTDLGEIQDLPDATAKELREAALTEMGAS